MNSKINIGWREWVGLPGLGISQIKAKIDSGARTSSLHAFYVDRFIEDGIDKVRFGIHPIQHDSSQECHCVAEVLEEREVSDSGGHRETRIVIVTPVIIGHQTWPIEMTLTNRDTMLFRVLIGRTVIKSHFLIDSGASFLCGKPKMKNRVVTGDS